MKTREEAVAELAARPEAYRETEIDFGEWTWRDDAAAHAQAQYEYEHRLLASIETSSAIAPSRGWDPHLDRIAFRGVVDAVLFRLRGLPPEELAEALNNPGPPNT